ncbi:selenoneine biosynthesis selenosugar synthase SenB [Actinomadura alba]|uniref:TIGR04348 family glycosyltransferase n=1 Tax=Actinomadura alba TaxID=406431 RepID=A0ABR7M0C2_9ACTN|nr:selenoneine biosynthesis selenosugar synthase SenB [Actinomadura alba]MBC6470249.1 TIGR04348 family glycosyltransferase [Actinomadura alba]
MILLVTPTALNSDHGNGVSARRWAAILRELGHEVYVTQEYRGGVYSALVALHARKSADSVRAFNADHPRAPIVVALTGTDLYPDLDTTGVDPDVLALAERLIVLQPHGLRQLPPAIADRGRVIIQSMSAIQAQPPLADRFEVVFLAHLRPVKDPLLLAQAVRLLPANSKIFISHAGAPRDAGLAAEAATETNRNPRYEWLGPIPRGGALALLARSRLLALTSLHEGGANVVSEALAAGVPVISSAIPGSFGLLGEDYPGYFPVGDAAALAEILDAVEENRGDYYTSLKEHCVRLGSLVDPAHEKRAFAVLLKELGLPVID